MLKHERVRRKTYGTREEARSDVFDYIEMFYNPKRRHSSAMQLSPMEYEKRYLQNLESVYGSRGDSYSFWTISSSRTLLGKMAAESLAHYQPLKIRHLLK